MHAEQRRHGDPWKPLVAAGYVGPAVERLRDCGAREIVLATPFRCEAPAEHDRPVRWPALLAAGIRSVFESGSVSTLLNGCRHYVRATSTPDISRGTIRLSTFQDFVNSLRLSAQRLFALPPHVISRPADAVSIRRGVRVACTAINRIHMFIADLSMPEAARIHTPAWEGLWPIVRRRFG